MTPDTPTDLTFTGERFHPDKSGEMWFEHWHRYHLVLPLVSGMRVLDVAAGEGYGSALLAGSAAQVIGIDISTQAIAHARRRYVQHDNLRFIEAPCHRLPLPDHSVDVVISFETLEHIHEQAEFLREIKRVLTHDGWLAISTPNKAEYSDARGYQNEFHVKELYRDQLATLLATTFTDTRWLTQRNGFHSLIHHEQSPITAQLGQLHLHSMPARQGQISAPLYYLTFASNNPQVLASLPLTTSAFSAYEDNQIDIFIQIWRDHQSLDKRHTELQQKIIDLEAELAALRAKPMLTAGDNT